MALFHRVTVPAAILVLGYLALAPLYQYQFDPDGIAYVNIARHYADGYWSEAINVHWSPLISWLLAPWIAFGASAVMAVRIAGLLFAVLTLWGLHRLTALFHLRPSLHLLVNSIGAVIILAAAVLRMGTDLLLAGLLLLYFSQVLQDGFARAPRAGLYCGLTGALAYLAKAYAFAFFLGHFTLLSLLRLWRASAGERRLLATQYAKGMLVFAVLSGVWIALISNKHGSLILSTTASFNFRLVGPDSKGYPHFQKLLRPPSEHAANYWEAPSPESLPQWSPLQSARHLRHQVRLIYHNIKDLTIHWLYVSLFTMAALLLYAVLGFAGLLKTPSPLFVLLTIFSYPAAYLLVIVQDRYMWPIDLLMLAAAVSLLELLFRTAALPRRAEWLLLALFTSSYLYLPLRQMLEQRFKGTQVHEIARRIQKETPLQGRLASCGDWNRSAHLAFYLDLPYYGITAPSQSEVDDSGGLNPSMASGAGTSPEVFDQNARAQLDQADIQYFLVWDDCTSIPSSVLSRPEVTQGRFPQLRIYRWK